MPIFKVGKKEQNLNMEAKVRNIGETQKGFFFLFFKSRWDILNLPKPFFSKGEVRKRRKLVVAHLSPLSPKAKK